MAFDPEKRVGWWALSGHLSCAASDTVYLRSKYTVTGDPLGRRIEVPNGAAAPNPPAPCAVHRSGPAAHIWAATSPFTCARGHHRKRTRHFCPAKVSGAVLADGSRRQRTCRGGRCCRSPSYRVPPPQLRACAASYSARLAQIHGLMLTGRTDEGFLLIARQIYPLDRR